MSSAGPRASTLQRAVIVTIALALAAAASSFGCAPRAFKQPLQTATGSTVEPAAAPAETTAADTLGVGLPLPAPVAGKGTIAGVVRAGDTAAPLPYANVIALRVSDGNQWGAATGPAGQFAITGLPPGTYQVRALYLGYEPLELEVRVQPNQATEVAFEMPVTTVRPFNEMPVEGQAAMLVAPEDAASQQLLRTKELSGHAVDTVDETARRQAGVVARSGELHVRGGRSGPINFRIDGVNTANGSAGAASSTPDPGARGLCDTGDSWVHDELWIIQKYDAQAWQQATGIRDPNMDPPRVGEAPGSGALLACLEGTSDQVPMPLRHTDVRAQISGFIASVEVTQQFHNPYDSKIEAVYVFPLPHNAAVNEFIMTIGDRDAFAASSASARRPRRSTTRPSARATSPRC